MDVSGGSVEPELILTGAKVQREQRFDVSQNGQREVPKDSTTSTGQSGVCRSILGIAGALGWSVL